LPRDLQVNDAPGAARPPSAAFLADPRDGRGGARAHLQRQARESQDFYGFMLPHRGAQDRHLSFRQQLCHGAAERLHGAQDRAGPLSRGLVRFRQARGGCSGVWARTEQFN